MSTISTVATLATPQTILGITYTGITVNPSQVKIDYTTGNVSTIVSLLSTNHSQIPNNNNSNVTRMITVSPSSFSFADIFSAVTSTVGYQVI